MPCDRSAAAARRPGVDIVDHAGFPIDLGCGWLHSADRNPWREIAQAERRSIDKTPPPWMRPSLEIGFPRSEQQDFGKALGAFFARLDSRGENEPDAPAATLLEPDCRWNNLINAVSTYISGVELDRQSVEDFYRYDDSGINWRVIEGYGSTIAAYGADLPVMLDCAVQRIDHRAKRLRIETAKGAIEADQAIVTIPSTLLAEERMLFTPALPEKTEAAAGLPLGLADKLFLSLEDAEEFENGHAVVRPHRPRRHRSLSLQALRPAADRGLFRRPVGVRARSGRRGGLLRLRRCRADKSARNCVRASDQPDPDPSLGSRPVFPRVLLLRAAGPCGLSSSTRRTGRQSPVLRRRGLLPRRLLDGPWCVPNRRRRRRSGDRRSLREPPIRGLALADTIPKELIVLVGSLRAKPWT